MGMICSGYHMHYCEWSRSRSLCQYFLHLAVCLHKNITTQAECCRTDRSPYKNNTIQMAQDTQPEPEYQLDARGKIENFDESDWFIPQELPFKVKHNMAAGMAASKPHPWKRLRQLIAAENYQELPANVPTYVNMEAPPSMYPPKCYCDITGCEAPYVDPKTHLRYANTEAFRVARSLTPDEVQARLAIRNAQYVLK